ncbi:MAG: 50S ribosomal protein L11 methyltransferase [Alistipes sp.]|nr:50S ribosomal protein L11 methyltransferase [Alistipes sp.]
MEYIELSVNISNEEQGEILTALLSDYPFEAFDGDEQVLRAYIQTAEYEQCSEDVERLLAEQAADYQVTAVEQQNWNAEWESEWEAVDVDGERPIRIRAEHHQPAAEGVLDVVIAPRMSFGTGHHTTTALMAQTIASMSVDGLTGLDMGCGTGVLAIVAVGCGAKRMMAVDIDDWACDSCRDSMALSGVEQSIDVRCGSIEAVKGEHYDFILANINRNILTDMMPSFAELLSSGGKLLMSGFLVEDVAIIEASAAEYGFESVERKERDGWVVVVCRKI